ncbi:MAG: polysaccharide biosynthesis/export family protein [bacterium]
MRTRTYINISIAVFISFSLPFNSFVFAAEQPQEKQYVIRPNDQLAVIVYPADELSRDVTVQPDGNIELKLIGSVKASGMTHRSLSKLLELRFSAYVKKPQVSVIIKKYSGHEVIITGSVNRTGSFQYHSGMKLMELVSLAGGVPDEAAITKTRIIRQKGETKEIISVDLKEIMYKGLTEEDPLLIPGDIIFIPKKALARVTWFVSALSPWLALFNFFLLIGIAASK